MARGDDAPWTWAAFAGWALALAGAPGLVTLLKARTHLRKHREACRLQAREWAPAVVSVPRALADADPLWREGSTPPTAPSPRTVHWLPRV